MRTLKKRIIEFAPDEGFTIRGFGDFHLGAIDTNEELLRRHVADIVDDPNAYWVAMGDYGDHIVGGDRRYSPGMVAPDYEASLHQAGGIHTKVTDTAAEILAPIADRCLAIVQGNHELTIWDRENRDLAGELATKLELPELLVGYSGWVPLGFRRASSQAGTSFSFNIHVHHGWKGGRTPGTWINSLIAEKAMYPEADLIMRGHGHQRAGAPLAAEGPGGARAWAGIQTGTYKLGKAEGHTVWEERMNFPPKCESTMGSPIVHIRPNNQRADTHYGLTVEV